MKTKSSAIATGAKAAAVLLTMLPVAGCVVGPKYKRPPVAAPATFRSQIGPAEADSIADLPWWGVFNDKPLQALISEALANNYDLQVATARIEQAKAEVTTANSEALPQLGYAAAAEREKTLVPLPNTVGTTTYTAYGAALNASWEIDVWGRIRHLRQAARANLFAQEDVRRGVMLTLVSDLATDYFTLLELDRELAVAEESERAYKNSFDLFNLRFQAGKDSRLPVERAKADYDQATATAADLKRRITQQENAICVLLGANPRPIERGRPLIEQVMPPTPVGATTDLLQRRPDILQAEQVMKGANEEIGVAVANYFPQVDLSALVGDFGVSLGPLNRGFGVWNTALQATGPIFTGGRLGAEYKGRRAYWDETIAQYKQIVITAFRETSDALIAQQMLVHQRAGLESRVRALRQSVDLSVDRYHAGRASYFEVLEAQQQLFPAEDALAQTERDQLLAVVNLYKALGGGWKLTDAQWTQPH